MWYEFKAHWLSLHDCWAHTLVYLQVTHSNVYFVIICTCNKYIPLICLLLIHKHLVYMKYIPGYTLSICLHIIHTHIQFAYMQYIHIFRIHTYITTRHISMVFFSDQSFFVFLMTAFRRICLTGFYCTNRRVNYDSSLLVLVAYAHIYDSQFLKWKWISRNNFFFANFADREKVLCGCSPHLL